MKLQERIILFSKLKTFLLENFESEEFQGVRFAAKQKNAWFTLDNISNALKNIIDLFLEESKLNLFVANYLPQDFNPTQPKKVGIIAAGNLPLVGFQDLVHVILSGHIALFKPSSQDEALILYIRKIMLNIEPKVVEYFKMVEMLKDADAIIATGSGNSSRYFEYYFALKPHIIRKNRNSVAVLDGTEHKIDLVNLGNDIFEYFGLGCRNISKLYVPKGYNFEAFFEAIEYWNTIRMHSKYNNNYDYMKAIYLVNIEKHLDNGFLLLKENSSLSSPIAVLYYEEYEDIEKLDLEKIKDQLQVIISKNKSVDNAVGFGKSQAPELGDFADNIDTIKFLASM